jgi:hypothetical protein
MSFEALPQYPSLTQYYPIHPTIDSKLANSSVATFLAHPYANFLPRALRFPNDVRRN